MFQLGVCCLASGVKKYVGNSATVIANIVLAKYIYRCFHSMFIRKILRKPLDEGFQCGWSIPIGIVIMLADDRATHRTIAALAAGREKGAIGYIIGRQ